MLVFQSADGLEAGKTSIRYRSVDIGTVRHIALSPDHRTVRVKAEMVKSAAPLLVSDSKFWVVRPRVSTSVVSGLGTLLSGSYIGMDIGHNQDLSDEFQGLENPPVVTSDVPGREFILHGDTLGSISVGAPVYFRHIPVGDVTRFELDHDGVGVTISVFIEAPYNRFVVSDTRFWHSSGIDVDFGASGLQVHTESVASLLAGGVSFETPSESSTLAPAPEKTAFHLATSRDLAMKSPNEEAHHFVLYFKGSLRGLTVGSPVDLNGVDVGEVHAIRVKYDVGDGTFKFPVEVNIYQDRVRAQYQPDAATTDVDKMGVYPFVARLVEHGFRGQLRTSSLLTGQQYIALDFFPNAPRATTDPSQVPMEIPTVAGGLDELSNTLTQIASKINAVPIGRIGGHTDEVLVSLREAIGDARRLAARFDQEVTPELKSTLLEAHHAISNADGALSNDGPLQQNVQQALRQLTRAAESLRALTDYLDAHPEALIRGKPETPP